MATEAVNGMEYNQYGQPAELAASTPSHAASASQSSNTASGQQKADAQEIGWYFVEQYYTTLSKSPDKIHLFYNKKSQLTTGTEAEKVLPAVGSKAISEKIKSLDLSECKIRVLNVDSQPSYDNIVVQVIGEMSNKNQPHHKFVQTFILATQPNGYFVLNDIFRYLNEDEDEVIDEEHVAEEASSVQESAPAESLPDPTPEAAKEVVNSEAAVEQADAKLEATTESVEEAEESVNGVDEATDDTEEADPEESTVESEADIEPASSVAEDPPAPESTPDESSSQTASTAAADGPPVKKTWASMVGTKAPVVPAIPQSQSQSQSQSPAPAPALAPTPATALASSQPKAKSVTPAQTPKPSSTENIPEASTPTSQSNGWQEAGKKTRSQSKTQEGIVHAYIKNVNDKIDARVLRDVLEKYGKLKYYDVSRPKQCAFVEFEEAAAYTAAVAENPHSVGSETINVEERRPRPGTAGGFNANYNRGNATSSKGRGGLPRESTPRGNFQGGQRGNKPSGPARGRGQGQGQGQAA